MNGRGEAEPRIELSTTRVGGGGSARLVALVTAGVLGAVVWVGLSGQAADEPAPAQLALPTAAATARSTLAPRRTPDYEFIRPTIPLGADGFGVLALIGSQRYLVVLQEIEVDHLYATMRLPFPRPAAEGTLELAQFWTRDNRPNFVSLGTVRLPLDPLVPETSQQGTVLDRTSPPQLTSSGVPRLVQRGYRLTVRAESRRSFAVLVIDVRIGPKRQLQGDDGIFGWPTILNLPGSTQD